MQRKASVIFSLVPPIQVTFGPMKIKPVGNLLTGHIIILMYGKDIHTSCTVNRDSDPAARRDAMSVGYYLLIVQI